MRIDRIAVTQRMAQRRIDEFKEEFSGDGDVLDGKLGYLLEVKDSLDRLAELEARNEVLEAAVAFKGFDEAPSPQEQVEVKMSDDEILRGTACELLSYLECHTTADKHAASWRYPVGDLS